MAEPTLRLVPMDIIERIQKVNTFFVPDTLQDDDLDRLGLQRGDTLWVTHLSKTYLSSLQKRP